MSELVRNASSFLFVPASLPERLTKAFASGADIVIADWEDAVAPADKDKARSALLEAAQQLTADQRQRLLVRINAIGSAWFDADLQALTVLVQSGVAGAVVPKAENAEVLAQVAQTLGQNALLVPLVESVAGMDALDQLAASPQVVRLAFGHLDFQVDAGMQCAADESELLPTRMAFVMASRRAGLGQPIDGVTTDTRNSDRITSDTQRAQRMGFGAKLCIHPAQVSLVHEVFAPGMPMVEHATAVIEAMQAAGGGVCVVNGKMVDAPVLHLAQNTLKRHVWALKRQELTR